MKDKNWSYLAGLFDGEGTVFIGKQSNGSTSLQINISSTELPLMNWLISTFGGVYYTQRHYDRKIEYKWQPKGKKNREVMLLGILPYLIIKRERALLALKFDRIQGHNQELREQLRMQMKTLNKGSVTTNTRDASEEVKIESALTGDRESAPLVTAVPTFQ